MLCGVAFFLAYFLRWPVRFALSLAARSTKYPTPRINHAKEHPMSTTEQTLRFLEEHIPELAESAVTQAYWQALASGSSVLESDNGVIYEVFPDGTRKVVKTTTPPSVVTVGEKRVMR
jgi:hypothetical protein